MELAADSVRCGHRWSVGPLKESFLSSVKFGKGWTEMILSKQE